MKNSKFKIQKIRRDLISIAKGMHQAKLASEGKFKSRSINSFLNELHKDNLISK